ncbi:MAG: protein kinase, partial [Gemmataceae bacterium]|nr:protein kinase [Gemmataceae bacterium]
MIRHPAPARPAAAVAPCPSDADLAGWLAGSFPPGAADHLTDCPGCRSRADAMADADPVLGRAREALDRTPVTAPGGWAGLVRPTAPAVPPDIPGLDGAEFVGRGGMGVVYRAWQARLGRPVAVKVMSPWLLADPDHRARFAHEAAALGRLNHPNVVAVYDHGGAAGQPYLVLEWVPGSLAGRLRAGPLPPRAAVGLVRDA